MPSRETPRGWERPVLLSAGFPHEDDEVRASRLHEIEEALLSFTRAVLAQGGRIVLPADRVVAPLVAETAAEYAPPLRTEATGPTRPLVGVLLTEGRDAQLEQALAALGHVTPMFFGDVDRQHTGRHRLTIEAVESVRPSSAVVLGAAPESLDDIRVLQEREVLVQVVGEALAGSLGEPGELWHYDVTRRILQEIEWRVDAPGARHDLDVGRRVPYPYVMQRLVEEWGTDDRR